MKNFYDQQIPIDEILAGLKTYVLNIINLIKIDNPNNVSDCQCGFFDDSLYSRLSGYDDELVISNLEHYLSILESVKESDIEIAIPDDDWSDKNRLKDEREQIFTGIEDTIKFVNRLIEARKQLLSACLDDSESKNNEKEPCEREQLILSIFGYLKDDMSISDWKSLKKYLCQFIVDFKMPQIKAKLEIPNIKRWEFYYLFKCLNFKLNNRGVKTELRNFEEFIRGVFPINVKTLRNKISETPQNKPFSRGFPEENKVLRY